MANLVVSNWDTNQPGAQWDVGLQWDVNVGPNPGDVSPYLARITSKHNQKPKYMQMVGEVAQPFADNIAILNSMYALFDVDVAVGAQLDVVGQWIGVGRDISVPLTGVYFSYDTPGLGLDEGTIYNSFNPLSGLVRLGDEAYRTLLYARIANNHWDGSIEGAYVVWDIAFSGTGIGILIQDLGGMHMIMALTGDITDAVTLALFKGGYLSLKPAGVRVDAYYTPSVPNTPYFGLDVENDVIAGLDVGAWGV